jgi:hypothetical protein
MLRIGKYIVSAGILLQMIFVPLSALAQAPGTPGNIIPTCNNSVSPDGEFLNANQEVDACDFEDLLELLRNVIRFLSLFLLLPALTVVFLYAGVMLLLSAGNPSKRQDAKRAIEYAVWGLLAMIGAWFIIEGIYTGLGYGGFLDFGN